MSAVFELLESRAYFSASLPLLVAAPTPDVPGATAQVAAADHRNRAVIQPAGKRHRPHVNLISVVDRVPATATLGSDMTVTVTITNNGNKTADGTLDVLFEESNSPTGTNGIMAAVLTKQIDLNPGDSTKVRYSVPLALGGPTGSKYIVAVVDPQDTFGEAITTDNVAVSRTAVDIS